MGIARQELYAYTVKRSYPPDLSDPFNPLPRRTAEELRAFFYRNPTPDTRDLLKEIKRLQKVLLSVRSELENYRGGPLRERAAMAIARINLEPCVHEANPVDYRRRYQDAIEHSERHWAHDALARANGREEES